MFTVPFDSLAPTKTLWVSPNGSDSNNGSKGHPFKTIQHALDHATPGTAVMVKAGTYAENVEFRHSGRAGAPISLISADGEGKAHIKPGKHKTGGTIEAFGEDYIVIDGFDVSGGDRNTNGIIVTQGGSGFKNMTHHVVIKNNTVHDAVKDGIKVAQGDDIYVVNNRVHHVGDQGIDFVAVNDSVIARNEIRYVSGMAAMYVKGGSTHVLVADNLVAHARVDGIVVGGWTGEKFMRPGFRNWEAKDVVVIDNEVHAVGKRPLNILGAQDVDAIHNYLDGNPNYPTVINISASTMHDPPLRSFDIALRDNVLDRSDNWLHVDRGQGGGLVRSGNRFDGKWDGDAGLGGDTFPYTLSWKATATKAQAATLSMEDTRDDSGQAAVQKSADAGNATDDDPAPQTAAIAASPEPANAGRDSGSSKLAAGDLFSDADDNQIPGTDSGTHSGGSSPPAAAGVNVAGTFGNGGHGEAVAQEAAAVEQQLQQG
jgi:hypothetical protein